MTGRDPARRIRLIHLLDTLDPAGVERSVLELVRQLDAGRFESRVWYLRGAGSLRPLFAAAGIPVTRVPLLADWDMSCVPRLVLALRAAGADILHTHHPAATAFGRLAAPYAGIRGVVTTEHAVHHWVEPERFINRLVRATHGRAGRVVAVSKTAEYLTVGAGAARPDQCRVIMDGATRPAGPAAATVAEARERARRKFQLPADDPVVAALGRLAPHKGLHHFLETMPLVLSERADAFFVIAGDGPERGNLEARAIRLGVADRLRFTGALIDPHELLPAVDAVVLPSTTEAGGLAALEAMAHGIPVVGTRVGGLAELLEDGAGLLVNPNAPRELAAVLLYLLNSRLYAAEVGGRGLTKIAGAGSALRMAGQYAALYEELLGGGPAA